MIWTPEDDYETELRIYKHNIEVWEAYPELRIWLVEPIAPSLLRPVYRAPYEHHRRAHRDVYAHGHERKTRSR